jgi:hypothetical protein
MGFIEALLEHVSIKTLSLAAVAFGAVLMAISRIREHRQIKSLGNYGPSLRPRLPFGQL